ncbi:MAG: hypothetical protein A4E58_02107 [Syntrophorhabdus sp. PtaB.Bin006]|nr:MAG: hypothetical protein A4E58_02107 [Syntrophorhabdus sp. PtaB.Bin006]
MPTLYKYKDYSGFYILTKIRNNFVTYQLTLEGRRRLGSLGVKPGEVFSRNILLGLIAFGEAYTQRSGTRESPGVQPPLFPDLPDEQGCWAEIPTCADCSSPNDLHFAELVGEKHQATLLCFTCREKKQSSIDTSVPLPLVTRDLLGRILAMKHITGKDRSVENYQKILNMKFEEKWDRLAEVKRLSHGTQGKIVDAAKEGGDLFQAT